LIQIFAMNLGILPCILRHRLMTLRVPDCYSDMALIKVSSQTMGRLLLRSQFERVRRRLLPCCHEVRVVRIESNDTLTKAMGRSCLQFTCKAVESY
jgi:hypothetical protein